MTQNSHCNIILFYILQKMITNRETLILWFLYYFYVVHMMCVFSYYNTHKLHTSRKIYQYHDYVDWYLVRTYEKKNVQCMWVIRKLSNGQNAVHHYRRCFWVSILEFMALVMQSELRTNQWKLECFCWIESKCVEEVIKLGKVKN